MDLNFHVILLYYFQFQDMIKNIRRAFKDNVKALDWMDKKTKERVEDKV